MRNREKSNLFVTFVLILCLCVGLLCGCSNDGLSKDDPVKITIWHYYNGAQQLYFDQLVDEFNATEGAKRGIIAEAKCKGIIAELSDKVIAAAEGKAGAEELPDVFLAYPETAYRLYKAGAVVNYRDFFSDSELDKYVDAYLAEGNYGGKDSKELMLIPVAKSTEELFINKTAWNEFEAATGADISKLRTWEGVVEIARQYYEWTDSLTPEPNDGKAFFGRDSHSNYFLVGYNQLCGNFFDVKDGVAEIHADKAAIRKLWDCFYVPMVEGWFAQYGKFRSDDLMTGDIIAFAGSSSAASYFPESVTRPDGTTMKIEAEVLPIPNFAGKQRIAVQQGAGLVTAKQGKSKREQEASVAFVKWFTEPEHNVKFTAYSGYMPVTKEATQKDYLIEMSDKQREAIEDLPTEAETKALKVGLQMLESYSYYVGAPFDNGNEARKVLDSSLIDKSLSDIEKIKRNSAGIGRSAAAKEFETDENFEGWLKDFLSKFKKLGFKTDVR